MAAQQSTYISISPLLKQLATIESGSHVPAVEIAAAVELVFENKISPVQFALLLWALHSTYQDIRPEVLAACAKSMRIAAAQVDVASLRQVIQSKALAQGNYHGGLCDIVGTGGDGHNTFNISTTSSIVASSLLMMAKHGNNSSTSLSGSADLLQHAPKPPIISATTAQNLAGIYERTNYAFLYAREWHPGMKYSAAVRKEVPVRTIFNLLGPLANPVHDSGLIETRILGVARKDVGINFAEALKLSGAKKAMVVCGDENLDELSCAGPTHCWYIHEAQTQGAVESHSEHVDISKFLLSPEDFGLPRHSLDQVHGGKGPQQNADILMQILKNELPDDDPVLHFVLLNTAALLTVSGVCEADTSSMGAGDDGKVNTERGPGGLRWKEGLRRARWCIKSGAALKQWDAFVDATNSM
ncbi:hypothetical protein AMS68_007895 [Peltaster fructicola]|uniref:Glycosyl transferase family 3 domain-containing protein n=1 Tax=Peltaster fructicola TaxID=286661 RepID=A0A6H0Y695_9PEZI|nr:hypothetical protein AMS68_007895 [Peltaster fructicola]